MMRKKMLLMIYLMTFISVSRIGAQTLVIYHANGTTTDIALDTKPRVEFQDDRMLIISTILDIEYPKQDVFRFTFRNDKTAINSAKNNSNVTQENGQLIFHGIKSSDKIAVYNTRGIRVPVLFQYSSSSVTLPLSAILPGVYLLCINGRTSKFIKR